MSFTRRSLFGLRRRLGSYESSKGRKLRRSIGRDTRSRRLHLEPLEDRSLLSVGVYGCIWIDPNQDGIREPGEPYVQGAEVEIFSSTDAVIGNADDVSHGTFITSNSMGSYYFTNLPAEQSYYVLQQDFRFDSLVLS